MEGICTGKTLWVQLDSFSCLVTNLAQCRVGNSVYICVSVVSQNLAPYENLQVEMSLVAFVIFRVWYHESSQAIHLLSVQMRLHLRQFAAIDSRNYHLGHPVLRTFLMQGGGQVSPSRAPQLVKIHLLLLKTLNALLYRFGDCAHYPAGFIIFPQHGQYCIFFVMMLV